MWYIVYTNKPANAVLEQTLQESGTPYYIPIQMVKKTQPDQDKVEYKEEHPLGKLIFVKTDLRIEEFIKNTEGIQCSYKDHATGRCATISDGTMDAFRLYLQDQNNQFLFLKDPFSKFSLNQRVRVKEGCFAGQEGRVVRVRRNKRLVVQIGAFAVCIFGVELSNLEPIND